LRGFYRGRAVSLLGVLSAQLANAKPPNPQIRGCKRQAAVIFSAMTCSKFRWPRKPSFLLVGQSAQETKGDTVMRLAGKVAIISGAASGMGTAKQSYH